MEKEKITAILTGIFLILLFLISIGNNYYTDYSDFCKKDTNCLIDLAKESSNFELCNKAENKNLCYLNSAIFTQNESLCEKTINNSEISKCYNQIAIIKNDITLCNKTKKNENCIFQIAINTNNYNLCNLINNSEKCIYSFAYYKKNISICDLSGKYIKTCKNKLK